MAAAMVAGCGQAPTPPTAEQQARANAGGFDVGLVYVVDLDGYHPVAGGAGVYGDDSFQGIYSSEQGDLRLTVDRAGMTEQSCPTLPIPAAEPSGAPVDCAADGDGWQRTSGDRREYAEPRGGVLIRASALATASAKTLRSAVARARPATSDELDDILPEAPATPVERGDISGDNAPDNHVGPGG